jgi:uncharacterized membrane protein
VRRASLVVAVVTLGIVTLTAGACGGGSPSQPTAPLTTSTVATTTTPATTTTVPATTTIAGSTTSVASTTTTPATGLAYVPDVKPILDADCVRCHSAGNARGGVSLSTYAEVMRTVTPGSASSALVTSTRAGGSMNRYFSGSATAKAETTRSWVVDYRAVETR